MPRRDQVPVELGVAIDALPSDVAGGLAADVAAEVPPEGRVHHRGRGGRGSGSRARPRTVELFATGRLRCIALPRDTVERALRSAPDLAWCVLEVLVSRIRG